jgi:ATP-dependent DNA ligase
MPVVLRFIEPCLPSPAERPPSGSNWVHEIKHDGYRLMARRDPVDIRLITRRRGLARFDVLRRRRNEVQAFLYAFDLLELDGADLRRDPIETRKATLARVLRKSRPGVRLNEHLEHDSGPAVFAHACAMGLEGIVSRIALPIRSIARLVEVQEPSGASGEARGGRELGAMTCSDYPYEVVVNVSRR